MQSSVPTKVAMAATVVTTTLMATARSAITVVSLDILKLSAGPNQAMSI